MTDVKIARALISVSDKDGLVEFAQALTTNGIEIISTGGTYELLTSNGIDVQEVSEHTGFPELMDGRVKTLHPVIHGGLLGRRESASAGQDLAVMSEHGIEPIDLLVVNLYPFEEVVRDPDCPLAKAIENIDIGGAAMVRSGAKNYVAVTTVVDVEDYQLILEELKASDGHISRATRFELAKKAFARIAEYDASVSNYLSAIDTDEKGTKLFPDRISLTFSKQMDMRYGENPHQKAAFYVEREPVHASVATSRQIQGKQLSYNNVADADAALECVKSFEDPACVIVKHANPCGVAVREDIRSAYERAFETDPTSAFGGIVAFNRELDEKTAQYISDRQFVEVIIAPSVSTGARRALAGKKNIRVMECGDLNFDHSLQHDYKRVLGGLLVQQRDLASLNPDDIKVVSERRPSEREMQDLMFAWIVAKFVRSNAIVYAKDKQTIGVGAGQMSRVYSAKIAAIKARDESLQVAGSVMASDAFFPFRDGIDAAAEAGITAVIEPGGSLRDAEVIEAANEADMAMLFTGVRHFRH